MWSRNKKILMIIIYIIVLLILAILSIATFGIVLIIVMVWTAIAYRKQLSSTSWRSYTITSSRERRNFARDAQVVWIIDPRSIAEAARIAEEVRIEQRIPTTPEFEGPEIETRSEMMPPREGVPIAYRRGEFPPGGSGQKKD